MSAAFQRKAARGKGNRSPEGGGPRIPQVLRASTSPNATSAASSGGRPATFPIVTPLRRTPLTPMPVQAEQRDDQKSRAHNDVQTGSDPRGNESHGDSEDVQAD